MSDFSSEFNISEELKKLPNLPGVYIMRDKHDVVIYVGKAINLKNRVRNYFQASMADDPKTKNILINIRKFEYIVTDSEIDALILENNLIKKHKPKYNVLLKDDKAYPYIKCTLNEDFPRYIVVRHQDKDKAKYFGPITSSFAVQQILEVIHYVWPVRECSKKIVDGIKSGTPCLNYHIGKCTAPCAMFTTKTEYAAVIEEINSFLNGDNENVVNRLQEEMYKASDKMEFENAAALRDKIISIKRLGHKSRTDTLSSGDQDIIAFARDEKDAFVQIFFIRNGKVIGRESIVLNGVEFKSNEEIMTSFVTQFYSGTPFIPKELVLQYTLKSDEFETIEKWLTQTKGQKVTVTVPQKGNKLKLVNMAANNADITLKQFGEQLIREKQRTEGAIIEILSAIGLGYDENKPVERIEAYDISNIQGFESVGSMVVFEKGKPLRSDYRKFKIKGVVGANDYASMEEVLGRRFNRYISESGEATEKQKFSKLPDIVFIDGGKPQVNAAKGIIESYGFDIPVCGMIKDDRHRTRGLLFDDEEITMPYTSEGFKLVTRIQDEVHRFAIEYHRTLREKTQIRSVLDNIDGIGETRRRNLMKHFKSIDAIKAAGIDELKEVKGMNSLAAEAVYNYFH